jgi:site-specific recombinase XerD
MRSNRPSILSPRSPSPLFKARHDSFERAFAHELITRPNLDHVDFGRQAATPAAARNFLDTMKGLFKWAAEREHVKADPTAEVKSPKRKKSDGFAPWTENNVEAYQRKWPIGTRQRVWLDVLLYTGLRRGDAVVIGKQYVREGVADRKERRGDRGYYSGFGRVAADA